MDQPEETQEVKRARIARLRKGLQSALAPKRVKSPDGTVHAVVKKRKPKTIIKGESIINPSKTGLENQKQIQVQRQNQSEGKVVRQECAIERLKTISKRLGSREFLLSREYLNDHTYLVNPENQSREEVKNPRHIRSVKRLDTYPLKTKQVSLNLDKRVRTSLGIRGQSSDENKEVLFQSLREGSASCRNLKSREQASWNTIGRYTSSRSVHTSPLKMRKRKKSEEGSESNIIAINKIATQLASTVRKNFSFNQNDVNKFIMAIQKKELDLKRSTQPSPRNMEGEQSPQRDISPALWSKGMAQLKSSQSDIISKKTQYLRSESLHPSSSPGLQREDKKGWDERRKPQFRAAHVKSAKAKKQRIPRSISSIIIREKLSKAMKQVSSRKYLNEENESEDAMPLSYTSRSKTYSSVSEEDLSTRANQVIKLKTTEQKKQKGKRIKEKIDQPSRRAKRLDFMKDLDTKISIELNQLLEKNSMISHKIQSHSSIGRTVNLRLISMLHRLKNRKYVIEAAYENLRRKEESEEFAMGVFKKWGMGENKYFKM